MHVRLLADIRKCNIELTSMNITCYLTCMCSTAFIQSNDATVKQNNNTQSFISAMSDKGVSTPMY